MSKMEVYGLHKGTSGRQCIEHESCGEQVAVGSRLLVTNVDLLRNNVVEDALAVWILIRGNVSCRVGYLPMHFLFKSEELHATCWMVTELLWLSTNSEFRAHSFRNGGVALCVKL